MSRLLVLLVLAVGAHACGDKTAATATPGQDASTTDAAAADAGLTDAAPVNNWSQGFGVKLTFHGGPADGVVLQMDRDLTDNVATAFAFGSVHKNPPAISLAVQDSQYLTWKTGKPASKLMFQFNFGNLIGSATDPLQLAAAGDYPFACAPPNLYTTFQGFGYRSTCPGLSGHTVVTDWSATQGGRFAGYFHGTLHVQLPDNVQDCQALVATCTVADKDWTVEVEGTFGFTLPVPDGK